MFFSEEDYTNDDDIVDMFEDETYTEDESDIDMFQDEAEDESRKIKKQTVHGILDAIFNEWKEDKDVSFIYGKMPKNTLENIISKKLTSNFYQVKVYATDCILIVKYEDQKISVDVDKLSDDWKKIHDYIYTLSDDSWHGY